MFLALFLVRLVVAVLVCAVVAHFFGEHIENMLKKLLKGEFYTASKKFLTFGLYVAGISGGVKPWDLQRYLEGASDQAAASLDMNRWVLEIFQTVMSSLQSLALTLLFFFLISLIIYAINEHMGPHKKK